ncbi:MAG: hypothetical protein ACRDBG_26110 [Waterburya sp.]
MELLELTADDLVDAFQDQIEAKLDTLCEVMLTYYRLDETPEEYSGEADSIYF